MEKMTKNEKETKEKNPVQNPIQIRNDKKKRKSEQAKSASVTINTPGKTKQGLITISPHVQKIPDEISKRWPSYFLMLVNYLDYYNIRYIGTGYFRRDKYVDYKIEPRETRNYITFHKSDLLKTMGCDPHLYKWVSTGYRMFVKIIDSEDFALFWKKGHKLNYKLAWNKDQFFIQNPLKITENDIEN